MKYVLLLAALLLSFVLTAQPKHWQQQVRYDMDVKMDVTKNRFTATQKLVYSNNSPDTLYTLFFHLYLNAFQPGSSMDARSQELGKLRIRGSADWDSRVKDRIANLNVDEIGYQKIKSIKVNGQALEFIYHETILEVKLKQPLLPNGSINMQMNYDAQVPLQIRRTGRDNPKNGVRYSMSQWYPKLCEYDEKGWHTEQYVAREFYGVWGEYNVNITIDKHYKLAGSGVLSNAAEIGWGYDTPGSALKPTGAATRTWKFSGKNIHDFMWAADTGYIHLVRRLKNDVVMHIVYKEKPGDLNYDSSWILLADKAELAFPFIEKKFGKYPYPQYSFVQGGDGGMEYAMATLITNASLGTAFHELMHSWYQMVLGFNESIYYWMDEGFTNFSETLVANYINNTTSIQAYRDRLAKQPQNRYLQSMVEILPTNHAGAYESYYDIVASGFEEPLTTHADHFETNYAYGQAAYSKGEVFLEQLGYIVGAEMRDKILLEFYNRYKFTHPTDDDFFALAQKLSGIQLFWYKQYWINTTKTIDYGIDSVFILNNKQVARLRRVGLMPMPIDLLVKYKSGKTSVHYVPLNLMLGAKTAEQSGGRTVHDAWRWTHPTYDVVLGNGADEIESVEIDTTRRMADVNRKNNIWMNKE